MATTRAFGVVGVVSLADPVALAAPGEAVLAALAAARSAAAAPAAAGEAILVSQCLWYNDDRRGWWNGRHSALKML